MKSKINFRQRKLAEQKSLVLILAPKTERKKKKKKNGSRQFPQSGYVKTNTKANLFSICILLQSNGYF